MWSLSLSREEHPSRNSDYLLRIWALSIQSLSSFSLNRQNLSKTSSEASMNLIPRVFLSTCNSSVNLACSNLTVAQSLLEALRYQLPYLTYRLRWILSGSRLMSLRTEWLSFLSFSLPESKAPASYRASLWPFASPTELASECRIMDVTTSTEW